MLTLKSLLISEAVKVAMTPTTTQELGQGDKLTFTCTFAGYPIKEIKITDPASKPISCPGSKDNITCTENNTNEYIVSTSYFELSLQGKYTCTITSEFWKDDPNNPAIRSHTKSLNTKYGNFFSLFFEYQCAIFDYLHVQYKQLLIVLRILQY